MSVASHNFRLLIIKDPSKMNNIKKYLGLCAATVLPSVLAAQTISFETQDYASLGAYDTWEQSPFRTGALAPNVAVVDNHLSEADVNESQKILGVQRSRFGSNTFGVKIDLKETFEISSTPKFAHVMIHKPVAGRVMLIGLGKRADRPEQSNQVEQFWSYPLNDTKEGEWFDAVFQMKGNNGVEIHSLVIVPHCEEPLSLTEDFIAYVDEIEINDSNQPRVGLGDYPINFSYEAGWGREDRKINGVTFTGGADGSQSITIPSSELKGYNERFEKVLKAKAGNTVTANVNYVGSWMHTFVYLDRGNDGEFSYGVDDNNYLDTSTDLVAYSAFRKGSSGYGRNSAGQLITNMDCITAPAFTIPADMKPGIYRMRYKVDWNDLDPGGSISSGNTILENGGGVVDVLLNIHEDEVTVNQDNRNGEVLIASTGEPVSGNKQPFGQSLKIKMNPSNGFSYNGIRVRHGYNLAGDSLVKSNPQYRDDFFYVDQFGSDDTFTIPGDMFDGDVLIEGLFVESGTGIVGKKVTYNIVFNGQTIATQEFNVASGQEYPEATITSEASESYYALVGYPEGLTTDEDEVITLTLEQTLPFQVSQDFENAYWYNMSLTADKCYLTHNPSLSYISLAANTSAIPAANDYNSQWAFVGDVINGFMIINRGAGEGKILSSNQTMTSSTDGRVYPIMTSVPVPETHNTYWIPTVGTASVGKDGFYLHQLGHTTNRMNSRDSRLAYWIGGAGAGSTFLVTFVESSAGIGDLNADESNMPVEYFNLQGVRVSAENLTPGIYIRRQNGHVTKVYVK